MRYLPSTILSKLEIHEPKKTKVILPKKGTNKGNGIIIAGSSDILSTLATCCNPVYGEDIVGYITRGYGVKIHAKSCPNIDPNSERIIEAKWEENIDNRYTAKLKVFIDDVSDILMNIVTIATKSDISIDSINLINRNKEMFYDITCKVKNISSLHTFIDEVKTIQSVREVERIFI
jgi:GTP pyrophosphokinase